MFVALLLFPTLAVAAATVAPTGSDLEAVMARLKARDEASPTAFLPFEVCLKEGDPGDHLLVTEKGWWAHSGDRFAYGVSKLSPFMAPVCLYTWGSWDGGELHELRAEARDITPPVFRHLQFDASADQGAMAYLEIRADRLSQVLRTAYWPECFGLGINPYLPWSHVFSRVSDVAVIGREAILGRECDVIVFDNTNGKIDDGVYECPWLVWLDTDDTTLSLRVETLMKPNSLRDYGATDALLATHARTVPDRTWATFQRWDAEEVFEFAPGAWLVTRGTVSHPACPRLRSYVMRLASDEVAVNQPIAEELFRVVPPALCEVTNQTDGSVLVVDEAGDSANARQYDFEQLVQRARLREGETAASPVRVSYGQDPWESSSCGPNALYLHARVSGLEVSLQDVLALMDQEDLARGSSSLEDLVGLANALGLNARAMAADVEEASRLGGWMIAHLEGIQEVDHFSLVRFVDSGERAQVFDPPYSEVIMRREALAERWRGHVLVFDLDGDPTNVSLDAHPSVATLVAGTSCLLGVLLVVASLLRRRAPSPVATG